MYPYFYVNEKRQIQYVKLVPPTCSNSVSFGIIIRVRPGKGRNPTLLFINNSLFYERKRKYSMTLDTPNFAIGECHKCIFVKT